MTYYVNRMGGIVCEACCPPAMGPDGKVIAGEIQIRLVTSGGAWDDAENPFDRAGTILRDASGKPVDPDLRALDDQFDHRLASPSVASLASPPAPQKTAPQASVDYRLMWQDPVSRQSIVQAAAIQGVSVTEWFDAVEVAFGTVEQQASVGLGGGWSSEPTWVRMDRLMQRIRKTKGMKVVW